MDCTASESYGLYSCDHCFTEVMRKLKEESPEAWEKWKAQEFERCERIRAQLEGNKND